MSRIELFLHLEPECWRRVFLNSLSCRCFWGKGKIEQGIADWTESCVAVRRWSGAGPTTGEKSTAAKLSIDRNFKTEVN